MVTFKIAPPYTSEYEGISVPPPASPSLRGARTLILLSSLIFISDLLVNGGPEELDFSCFSYHQYIDLNVLLSPHQAEHLF